MLLQRKSKPPALIQDAPLALRSIDGTLLKSFPPEVISSIRHMETSLICNDHFPTRVAVVSTLGGEGVTYITLALATTLASDLPVRICAVELNWWSPGMQTRISEPQVAVQPRRRRRSTAPPQSPPTQPLVNSPGIAAVLTGAATLDEALIPTALPNLMLLPAGELSPEQRPTIARSEGLKHCIDQLSRRFDHLLLDIPAILSTSDGIALASLASGCCIVIRQGVTPVNSVRRGLDDLQHLEMLGVVLNQTYTALPRWMHALIPGE